MSFARFPHRQGGRFAKRSYPARFIGLALGFAGVSTALLEVGAPTWLWVALVIYSFLWPHLAYFWAANIRDSFETGQRQMLFDSFCGGLWAAAMGFNIVPTVVVLTMLSMNNMASGGMRLFLTGLMVKILSAGLWVLVLGWQPNIESNTMVILASLPFLIIHPLAVGAMTYQFASRLYTQKNQLKQLSRTDGLTGIYNRRYWQSRAIEEFDRCHRTQHEAVMIMMDIDHFKKINDTYGHAVGDDVIRGVSEILCKQLRNIDLSGRYGGEEFSVVLPDTTIQSSRAVAERLLKAVENEVIGQSTPVQCTVSIGMAAYHPSMHTLEDWISSADQALYDAKNRGRNQYCVYSADKSLRVVSPPKKADTRVDDANTTSR